MKFAAASKGSRGAANADGEQDQGWEELDQMMRLKVQVFVDLEYLKE